MSYQIGDIVCDYRVFNDKTDEYVILNSRKNAETVKRILEVDSGVPNQATVCDMVEVVRCKDCKHSDVFRLSILTCNNSHSKCFMRSIDRDDFCKYGERRTDNEKEGEDE